MPDKTLRKSKIFEEKKNRVKKKLIIYKNRKEKEKK